MKKEKLLLIGYRAYGDWLYALPSLNELFKRYEIHLETNFKGWELFGDDPRFISKSLFLLEKYSESELLKVCQERWKALVEIIKPDRVINLWRTLETECIAERYQPEFFLSNGERRSLFGQKNFYEAVSARCETSIEKLDGLYFSEEQIQWAESWRVKHKNDFIILMPIAGSCSHKIFPRMPELSLEIANKLPDSLIYLLGDSSTKDAQWDHERIIKTAGTLPIKQAVLMAKHADFVFGGETGMLVAAGMWGTPKIMLCTSCTPYQACKYHKNDFSMQSNVDCSPCHRAVFSVADCEDMVTDEEGNFYPRCITGFDYNKIFGIIKNQYDLRYMQK